jgi:hypothetical protein
MPTPPPANPGAPPGVNAGVNQGVNHFDADAYLGTLERPSLTVGGRTFEGRFLGVEDWLRFAPKLDALAAGALPPTAMKALIRELTAAVFPPPPRWRVWRWGRPTAHGELAKLPLAVQLQALGHFTRSQATALDPMSDRSEAPPALGVIVSAAAATLHTQSASSSSA